MHTSSSLLRGRLRQGIFMLVAAGAVSCAAPAAHADEYLVGALLFAADASGASTAPTSYQYDTNSSPTGTTALDFTFNGTTYGKGISLLLPAGTNTLSFVQDAVTPISTYGGTAGDLGLFFSNTNTSYDPSSGARTPDLLVSRATNGSLAYFYPAAGTPINDYVFPGVNPYSGATTLAGAALPTTVSAFSVNDNGAGTVDIQVGAATPSTPEPGSLALLLGVGVTGITMVRRRRK